MNCKSGNNGNWWKAVDGYGPGSKEPNYSENIKEKANKSFTPALSNYR